MSDHDVDGAQAPAAATQADGSDEPRPLTRAEKWKHRAVYIPAMLIFGGALWWASTGRTQNADALQRQISVYLQGIVMNVEYNNIASGTILATGRDVFRMIPTTGAWSIYRDDETETAETLAAWLAGPLLHDRKVVAAWEAEGRPLDRLVVLPVPLMHFGEEMTATIASQYLAVATIGELPAYLFLRDAKAPDGSVPTVENPPLLYPVTREIGEALAADSPSANDLHDLILDLATKQQIAIADAADEWFTFDRPDGWEESLDLKMLPTWLDTDRGPLPNLAALYEGAVGGEDGKLEATAKESNLYAASPNSMILPGQITPRPRGAELFLHTTFGEFPGPNRFDGWPRAVRFERGETDGLWRATEFIDYDEGRDKMLSSAP